MVRQEKWEFARRSKQDDFEDLEPANTGGGGGSEEIFDTEADGELEEAEEEEENEEINLDNPNFQKGEMWNDYAEDMDFEE